MENNNTNHILIVLCIAYVCESLNLYILYPITPFLLVKFGIIEHVDNAGYYSGLFTAMLSLAQMLSCGYWGKISDKIGRKNVLIIGFISNSIINILFGFSTNIYAALLCRFACGMFNSNSAIIKSYVGGISTNDTKGKNFGYLSVAWSVGVIIGSFVGGSTYNLLFHDYPILILSVIMSIIYCINGMIVYNVIINTTKELTKQTFYDILEIKYNFPLFDILKYIKDTDIIYSIIIYVFMTIVDMSLTEILPLWMVLSTQKGGLNYSSNYISYVLTITAICGILSQPLYIYIDSIIKRTSLFKISILCSMLLIVCLPYTNQLNNSFVLLCVLNVIRYIILSWLFNLAYLFVSSSANSDNIGRVNGVAQSIGAIFKILCPLVMDPIFTVSANSSYDYFGYHTIFNIIAFTYIFPFIFVFKLDEKKIERTDTTTTATTEMTTNTIADNSV
jgi:MFS family permease